MTATLESPTDAQVRDLLDQISEPLTLPVEGEPAPAEQPPHVDEDGYLWDRKTGELIGQQATDRLAILDMGKAIWFLRHWSREQKRVRDLEAALGAEKAQLDDEYAVPLSVARKKAQFWTGLFPELQKFLLLETAGSKQKSVQIARFRFGLRTKPARWAPREEVGARAQRFGNEPLPPWTLRTWAKKHCPGALKMVEEFQISRIPKGTVLPEKLFELKPGEEVFYVQEDEAK